MRWILKYFFVWLAFFAFVIILLPLCISVKFKDTRREDYQLGGSEIEVYFPIEDKVISMGTEEYIKGVLMAEMPAEFELEALKAQAVAARTYMMEKALNAGGADEHKGAYVCTDSSHCQAYITDEDASRRWNKNASLYLEKCKTAVEDTRGVIAVYNNEPIKAVFHSVSAEKTEDAADVWGSPVDYLKSVSSPGGETAPKYKTQAEFTVDEFKTMLLKEYDIEFLGELIGGVTRSEGGSVKSVKVGNKTIKGTDIRRIFSLSSAKFDILHENDKIKFAVSGYGHGVGMSQYGANHYAKEGLGYKEILKKYYTGIDFARIDE